MSKHTPNKSLGQHWLFDKTTLVSICDSAELEADDVVLEVGPGHGTLTTQLVKRVSRVIAVEFDEALAKKLARAVESEKLEVNYADILEFDLSKLPKNYKVVANIPYYLTSNLLRRLLESKNPPATIVLLIQKEVAERIVARPGKMSILAVSAQYYADCSLGTVVPANLFTPPPKVDSQVVILHRKSDIPDIDTKKFFRIVRAGFGEKRKKLCNSLSGGLGVDKATVAAWIAELGWAETVRAQELSLDDWHSLFGMIQDQI